MQDEGKISIIIPVYNSEKWIEKCLNSVLSQTYENIEVIVVNDGSTDESGSICKRIAAMDSRVVFIEEINAGVSAARNTGLCFATGDYIQFVDSDDFVCANLSERLLTHLSDDIDLVVCAYYEWVEGKQYERAADILSGKYMVKDFDVYKKVRRINRVPWNKLFRHSMIKNQFDTHVDLGEDYIFTLDYMKEIEGFYYLNEPLYNLENVNDGSLNHKIRRNRLEEQLNVLFHEYEYVYEVFLNNEINIWANTELLEVVQSGLLSQMKLNLKFKEMIQFIKEYTNKEYVRRALAEYKIEKINHQVFAMLLKRKNYIGLYIFFKLKKMLVR